MMPKRNNSWQYAGQFGLVSACILSNVPAINRMGLVPPRGRSCENNQRPRCWDRRRPRLPASNITKLVTSTTLLSEKLPHLIQGSARRGQAGTPAVPAPRSLIIFTASQVPFEGPIRTCVTLSDSMCHSDRSQSKPRTSDRFHCSCRRQMRYR
jgi:hypothetical protein